MSGQPRERTQVNDWVLVPKKLKCQTRTDEPVAVTALLLNIDFAKLKKSDFVAGNVTYETP